MSSVQITDHSDEIKKMKNAATAAALEAIGQKAEGYAKLKCPVDTGRLRNSITHTFSGMKGFTHTYTDQYRSGRNISGNKRGYGLSENQKTTYSEAVSGVLDFGFSSKKAVYIGTNVEYASYVEFGTSKSRAQPYLKPAATEHGDEYKAILEHHMKNG